MKKSLIFLTLTILLFTACNKNKEGEDLVIGNWKMTKIYSGWGPVQIIPATELYLLKINSDHHYQHFHNDTLKSEGEWRVYSKVLAMTNTRGWIFKDVTMNTEMAIIRQGSKLEFYPDGLADGGGVEYEHY